MLHNIYSHKKYPSTDKNTYHSYIDQIYSKFDTDNYYLEIKNVLEIGVNYGDSIKLWKDYFINAHIYGIDSTNNFKSDDSRITIITGNAYSNEVVDMLPNNFDLIIDDGPHSLDSMIFLVQNYINKLNTNGYMIIEDIKDPDWFDYIENSINNKIQLEIKRYDLRFLKNRYDDMLLILKKVNNKNIFI